MGERFVIYGFLVRWLPRPAAAVATGVVYFLLMLAIVTAFFGADIEFRYFGL